MTKERRSPPTWRALLGFLIVPALIAMCLALLLPMYSPEIPFAQRIWNSFVLYLLVGGYPAAFVVGLPIYFILRNHLKPTLINCATAGAVVSALPWAVLVIVVPGPDRAYSNGHVTHINGVMTLNGWLDLSVLLVWIGAFGAVAGLAFWVVAVAGHKAKEAAVSAPNTD